MKLVIAEKPSVAMSLAAVLGATTKQDGYTEGGGYLVSWCVGHLVELAQPEAYGEQYAKWRREDLPIMPEVWKYEVAKEKRKQLYLSACQYDSLGRLGSALFPGQQAWAQTIPVYPNPDFEGHDRNANYIINSHPGLVDLFTDQTREELKLRQQEKTSVRKQLKETPSAPAKHSPVKPQER